MRNPRDNSTINGHKMLGQRDNAWIIHDHPDDLLGIILNYEADRAGGRWEHPNITRSQTVQRELRHGKRTWRYHTLVDYLLVFKREDITLIDAADAIWSYPVLEIAGIEIHLDVSAQTDPKGGPSVEIITNPVYAGLNNPPAAALNQLAAAAHRGTSLENYRFADELEREFWANAGDKLITVCAQGDWHAHVPKGMVLVTAVPGGHPLKPWPACREKWSTNEQCFLVPNAEYTNGYFLPFIVDPTRHSRCDANGLALT